MDKLSLKIRILILTLGLGVSALKAQSYMVAFGPRLGMSNGLSIKMVTKSPNVLEGMIHLAHKGVRFTGMYQYLRPFNGRTYTSGWYWFIGMGGHFANYAAFEYIDDSDGYIKRITYQGFGLDLIAGLEYSFDAPLSISVDLKPYYEVQTFALAPSHFIDIAITLRHTFF